jgi:hypothetical protein
MDDYGRSATGRLMALSIGIGLVGSGASTFMAPGSGTTVLFAFALFIPIVIMILAIPHALEKQWYHAVMSVMFLPVAAWVYTSNIAVVREHAWVAYLTIGLGIGALGFAARGSGAAGSEPAKHAADSH